MVNVKYGRDSLKAAGRATLSGEIPDLSKLGRIYTRRLEPATRIATFVEAVNERPAFFNINYNQSRCLHQFFYLFFWGAGLPERRKR